MLWHYRKMLLIKVITAVLHTWIHDSDKDVNSWFNELRSTKMMDDWVCADDEEDKYRIEVIL